MDGIEEKILDLEYFKEASTTVFKKHSEIIIAYIYGSTIQNTVHKFSDIDVGLVLSPNFEPQALYSIGIQYELETLIKTITNRLIDVRILNGSSPRFLNQAVSRGVQIYCSDQDFKDEFEIRVLHAYLDIKPILDMFENAYLIENIGE